MDNKKIVNIDFYKDYVQGHEEELACIFYSDGTYETVDYNVGVKACLEVAKNNNIVHDVTKDDLSKKIGSYIVKDNPSNDEFDEDEDFDDEITEDIELEEENAGTDMFDSDIDDSISYDENIDKAIDTEIDATYKECENDNKVAAFFKKIGDKIKSLPVTKLTAMGTAAVMAFTVGACNKFKTKEGKMLSSNIVSSSETDDLLEGDKNSGDTKSVEFVSHSTDAVGDVQNVEQKNSGVVKRNLVKGNNDLYDDYTYEELLEVTENKFQKTAMSNLYTTINGFNGEFASHYTEVFKINGKKITVKPALSFDELVTLQVAYNKYDKKELRAYFNGAEMDSEEMTRFYKDASLQLMGAYVIETKENPLDMSVLIESEEGKKFYAKYHKMFLEAKNATGQDKLNKVKKFYYHVRKDFPVTKEAREEGIAHAASRSSLEDYKLAVTPMIAAGEMLFQNLEVDYTLKKVGIKYINDIGLCNYAEEKFDKVEIISLYSEEDNTNPLYIQYRDAIIKLMRAKKQYAISDEHRELTNLSVFQKAINWHFELLDNAEWSHNGGFYTNSTTRTETETWTETTTTYYEETTYTEKPIPADVKAQIDAQIDAENAEAERRGYEDAERERQRLQAIEDENAKRVYEEVEQDERDMYDRINHANDTIDNGGIVNEFDFGYHDVDFDSNHSDSNGNLDRSVEDITTDPTNDQTNQPLPDPNQTGAQFDAQVNNDIPTDNYNYTYNYSEQEDYTSYNSTDNNGYTQTTEENNNGYTQYVDEDNYIEFPSGYNYSYNQSAEQSYVEYESQYNEAVVDNYINSLSSTSVDDDSYQYIR